MPKEKLTQSRLKELLHYNPTTGAFTWKSYRTGTAKIGDVAGHIGNRGYRQIRINGKAYTASRLAWFYVEGYWPEHEIDHRNRKKDDNRWENLRHVSSQCNQRNCGMLKNNKSGVKGVRWYYQRSKWRVGIMVTGKHIYLGMFDDKIEAVKARWQAEKEYRFSGCSSTSSAYLYLKERGLL